MRTGALTFTCAVLFTFSWAIPTNAQGIWGPTALAANPGTTITQANGINDAGQIVGTLYNFGASAYRAFLRTTDGGMVDLGTLGGTNTSAAAINNAGQVVGSSEKVGTTSHAFF